MQKIFNRSEKSIFIIAIAALLVVVMMVFLFMNLNSQKTINTPTYQIVAGQRMDYSTPLKLVYTKEGTQIKGESNSTLGANPLYYIDEYKIILPKDMVYVRPQKLTSHRINKLSTLTSDGKNVFLDDTQLHGGFLYDGKSTYIFLEEMNISLNDLNMKIAPFSCVELFENGMYSFYEYGSAQAYAGELYRLNVEVSNDFYKVLVDDDVMELKDKGRILLFNRPDLLEEMK